MLNYVFKRLLGLIPTLLIVAVLVFLGDGIYVVYALLSGELTARFAAKAVLVAGVAALVLAYYRDELDD